MTFKGISQTFGRNSFVNLIVKLISLSNRFLNPNGNSAPFSAPFFRVNFGRFGGRCPPIFPVRGGPGGSGGVLGRPQDDSNTTCYSRPFFVHVHAALRTCMRPCACTCGLCACKCGPQGWPQGGILGAKAVPKSIQKQGRNLRAKKLPLRSDVGRFCVFFGGVGEAFLMIFYWFF